MIHHSHLRTAVLILESFRGEQPFALFIREFFRADKKYGSRDRRQITHLCYCYFRTGHLADSLPLEEALLAGLFLCSEEPNLLLTGLRPEWESLLKQPMEDKLKTVGLAWHPQSFFPGADSISEHTDRDPFLRSHFTQPDLFLRIRPGGRERVLKALDMAAIPHRSAGEDTLALPNGSKVEEILSLDKDVVVQDLSSQRVGGLMKKLKRNDSPPLTVWDCCAASGGKSIMAIDLLGAVTLTVSDLRQNILHNLEGRFNRAGIPNNSYQHFVADLSTPASLKRHPELSKGFDLLLADVPCSGSGTWGRAPEHLRFFREQQIREYALLQRKIIDNTLAYVNEGGHYLYITCSVYRQENEEQAAYIAQQENMQLIEQVWLNGSVERADTMYAALFRRSKL